MRFQSDNANDHPVAASDVDLKFRPAGNSGGSFCYPLLLDVVLSMRFMESNREVSGYKVEIV